MLSRKGGILSLRRHDPDQVQRVTALLALVFSWRAVGISAPCRGTPWTTAILDRFAVNGRWLSPLISTAGSQAIDLIRRFAAKRSKKPEKGSYSHGSQRQSAYTPPFDGTRPGPTLVGESGSGSAPNPDEWQIELRRLPILHRGHAVLVLRGPDGEMEELNGVAKSRRTDELTNMGMDGAQLYATKDKHYAAGSEPIAIVASGSRDRIDNDLWARASRAAEEINAKDFDYKAHDPAYEFGGGGGEIQNSNSVAYTLGRAMGLDLDRAVRDAGAERRFSGWGRDLLDPRYKQYAAPPLFAVGNAP